MTVFVQYCKENSIINSETKLRFGYIKGFLLALVGLRWFSETEMPEHIEQPFVFAENENNRLVFFK